MVDPNRIHQVHFESVKNKIEQEFEHLLVGQEKSSAKLLIDDTVPEDLNITDESLAEIFYRSILTLKAHLNFGGLTARQVTRLLENADRVIRYLQLKKQIEIPKKLGIELGYIRGVLDIKEGKPQEAYLNFAALEAPAYEPAEDRAQRFLHLAQFALRAGMQESARTNLDESERWPFTPVTGKEILIFRLQLERITGHLDTVKRLLREHDVTADSHLMWQSLMTDLYTTGNLNPLVDWVFRQKNREDPQICLQAALAVWAGADLRYTHDLPSTQTIRRSFSEQVKANAVYGGLFHAVVMMENAYKHSEDLGQRLDALRQLVSNARRLLNYEDELLVLVAVERFLKRYEQADFLDQVTEIYQNLVGRLGLQEDPLVELRVDGPESGSGRKIGVGGADLLAAGVKIGSSQLTKKIRDLIKNPYSIQELERHAKALSDAFKMVIAKMRGPTFRYYHDYLSFGPEMPLEIRRAIEEMPMFVQVIPPAQAKALIAQELGQSANDLFLEFEEVPFAIGSIGQVHRAITKDGLEVAVKIQYPGIEAEVANDHRLNKVMIPIFKWVLPMTDIVKLNQIVQMQCTAECDYELEASFQAEIGTVTANWEGVTVPRVLPELSTRRILTSEYIRGLSLVDFSEMNEEEERKRVAELIYSALFRLLLFHGIVYADPRPANILVTKEGIALVDFGFCTKIPNSQRLAFRRILKALAEDDFEEFSEGMRKVGVIGDESKFDFVGSFKNIKTVQFDPPAGNPQDDDMAKRASSMILNGPNRKYLDIKGDHLALGRMYIRLGRVLRMMGVAAPVNVIASLLEDQ